MNASVNSTSQPRDVSKLAPEIAPTAPLQTVARGVGAPQIGLDWNADATRALRAHADAIGAQLVQQMPAPSPAETRARIAAASKRALNAIVRAAIARTLGDAQPLYPALSSQLERLDTPAQFQLDLTFTDDAAMTEINAEYRGKNKPTDVLSFPVWEGETFPMPSGQTEIMLGDIVISIDTAIRQASELDHDLRVELAFLAVHGTLHLLGYDHDTDGKRRAMFGLQDRIVARMREDKGL